MSVARERLELAAAYTAGVTGDVLATVIDVRGSSYRKRGARAIFRRDGSIGGVSGGCLERDIARRAAWLTSKGRRIVRYDTSIEDAEEGGTSLGCGGSIALLVERIGSFHAALSAISTAIARNVPVRIATVVSEGPRLGASVAFAGDQRLPSDDGVPAIEPHVKHGSIVTRDGFELMIEIVEPPPRLLICGAGQDAFAVRDLATRLGFVVTVAGREVSPASIPRASSALFAVVMTHSLPRDRAWLKALLPRDDVRYVGLLGPRRRAEHLVGDLSRAPAKLHAPVGLDLGGEGPEAIALSIVAELEACRAGKRVRPSQPAAAGDREDRAQPHPALRCALDRVEVGIRAVRAT